MTVMAKEEMRIEYVRLTDVLKAPRNPKRHDERAMDASIDRFGFADPPTVDERSGELVEGHGRFEALQRRKDRGAEPPARVRVDKDGEWLVPIVRGVRFKSAKEAEAYLLAHNRIGDDLWDGAALAEVLEEHRGELDGVGWTDEDALKLIAKHRPDYAGKEFDVLDESIADEVKMTECPKCNHRFPA